MAQFKMTGIDGVIAGFEEISKLSEDEVYSILDAGAAVLVKAYAAKLASILKRRTGKLFTSMKAFHKTDGGRWHVLVYPEGTHHKYQGREKTKVYKRSKHGTSHTFGGGNKTAHNEDLAFIYEYGAPSRNIPAHHWMEAANEESGDELIAAEQEAYNTILQEKGF